MALDDRPRAMESAPRARLTSAVSFAALGVAFASAIALWLWLKSDVGERRGTPSRADTESSDETNEARHHDVPRLGASPVSPRGRDAGTPPSEEPDEVTPDAGAYAGITFVDPVAVPPGEAPALAEDTGLIFGPQADPAHQPGLEAKRDEPAPSQAELTSIRAPFDPGAPPPAVPAGPSAMADEEAPPVALHEQTASEDAPPVERFNDTGLVFRNTPSDSK